ncbi:MAG TPA: multicopper oxidase domain-containing protein [Natronosporangium sp.]
MLKRILIIGVVAAVLVGGATAAGAAWLWNQAALDTAGKVEFANPLAIPPLAESEVDADGRRVFDLTAAAGNHDFGRGTETATWGFNGDYLGPTLRARRGEQVVVNVHNRLGEGTTVHWHGMHLPPAMDGNPHQLVAPGETWSPTWRVDQPAATLWYHPHPHGQTEHHVYRGLAGMFILDDAESSALPLPKQYGVDDIPVIVQDKKFGRDGKLNDTPGFLSGIGVLGDTIAVNGTVAPYFDVTTERVRLRLLNGSTARTYEFGFADDRTFALIGTDGGLLPAPYQTDRIRLSPGERAEIVVTMAPGEEAVLRSFPPSLGPDLFGRFHGGDDTLDILQLRAAGELTASPPVPERLVEVPRIDPAEAVETRSFDLSGHQINGRKMSMDRIDAVVTVDTVERWRVVNNDGQPHTFHVHDVQFQVVSVAGATPPPELQGWKDTVYLPPQQPYELVMRFTDYADPATPYMYHCHLLKHEDSGMMGQFVVVGPGQEPAIERPENDAPGHAHHHG